MGGVIDTIVDIVEDVVDAVVDVIETVVDAVVDVVEGVIDGVSGILGFDSSSQVVEQFEIHNQPLFDEPDRNALQGVILDSLARNEDLAANLLFADVFQNGKKSIRKFVNYVDASNYFEDFPVIEASIMYIDRTEVTSVLNTKEGGPCTIETAHLGSLFVSTWVKYWLQENHAYDLNTNSIVYNTLTYNVDVFRTQYNAGTDDYTLFYSDDTGIISPTYVAPSKPLELHYIVRYHVDSAPTTPKLFVYKVGAGTYPTLDDPTLTYGDPGTTALDILPAIPLRLNNTNFIDGDATKADQIRGLVDNLGLDADALIEGVMQDVADSGITDYENKVDHVFLNFGVRIWDTSQIGMNYLYRLFSVLHANQGTTQAIYDSTPAGEEKPYNTVVVTATDYKYAFRFAYITYEHTPLSYIQANPSSPENAIYYSDPTRFDNGTLKSVYYSSTGIPSYNVGYKANSLMDVQKFLDGTLSQETGYSPEAANWLQVDQRYDYPAVVINPDGSRNYEGVLKPDAIYEVDPENVTQDALVESFNSTYVTDTTMGDGFIGISVKEEHSTAGTCQLGTTYGILQNAQGVNHGIWVDGNCRATFNVEYGINANFHASESMLSGTTTTGTPFSYIFDSDPNTTYTIQPSQGATYINVDTGDMGPQHFHEFHVEVDGYHTTQTYTVYYDFLIQYSDDNVTWYDSDRNTSSVTLCDSSMGTCVGQVVYAEVYNTLEANPHQYWRVKIDRCDTGDSSYVAQVYDVDAFFLQTDHLKLVNKAAEATTQGQEFTFYQCAQNGLNAYTVKAPIGMLRVVDAQTGVFKMVKFNIANQNDLMVPLSFDLVQDLPNSHVTSLFLDSAHISLYVAHYEVIELPWWAKLLQIVQVVLLIMAIIFPPAYLVNMTLQSAIYHFAKRYFIQLIIKEIVTAIAKDISPELALIVGAVLTYEYGIGEDVDFTKFNDLADVFAQTADLISSVVVTIAEGDFEAINEKQQAALEAYTESMDELKEVQESLFQTADGSAIDLATVSLRSTINPMAPGEYYKFYDNFHEIGLMDYDYANKYDSIYDIPQYA